MQVKICNRCGADVPALPALGSVTLPADDPSTKPKQVVVAFSVSLALSVVERDTDLCPVCLVSAFVEYALVAMKDVLTPKIARQLQARINAALGFIVSTDGGAQ